MRSKREIGPVAQKLQCKRNLPNLVEQRINSEV